MTTGMLLIGQYTSSSFNIVFGNLQALVQHIRDRRNLQILCQSHGDLYAASISSIARKEALEEKGHYYYEVEMFLLIFVYFSIAL